MATPTRPLQGSQSTWYRTGTSLTLFGMAFLIDGYNLLFASGFASPPAGTADEGMTRRVVPRRSGELDSARQRLLQFLATKLTQQERRGTTIVFDANQKKVKAENEFVFAQMRICFAQDFEEADDLIELLLRKTTFGQDLTVISSDHRIQEAARRRRIAFIDADDWMMQLEYKSRRHVNPPRIETALGDGQRIELDDDTDDWLRVFEDVDLPTDKDHRWQTPATDNNGTTSPPSPDGDAGQGGKNSHDLAPPHDETGDLKDDLNPSTEAPGSPFPPGYAEDLDFDEDFDNNDGP